MKNKFFSLLVIVSVLISIFSINGKSAHPMLPNAQTEKLYLIEKPSSEFGYVDYSWVDDEGNEVNIDNEETKQFSKPSKRDLPVSYDAREYGYVTEPKNQGVTGSCWSFASVASAESNLLFKGIRTQGDENSQNNLSEAHLTWFTHRSLSENTDDSTYGDGTQYLEPYSTGGNWILSTSTLARGSGFALESDYPFHPFNPSNMGNYTESERYISQVKLKNAFKLPNDRGIIKDAILNYGSIMTAYFTLPDYYNYTIENCSYYQNIETNTNHQVLIVGWDDNYAVSNFKEDCRPENPGAWLIKNSGGTTFGKDGYFYLSYEDPSLSQFVVQDVEDAENINNIYQYDGYGYSLSMSGTIGGERCTVGSIANVFTAKETESLSEVGFYAPQDDVLYTIEIYTGVTRLKNTPIYNGTKVSEISGHAQYKGYYTKELPQEVELSQHDSFTIVVKYEVAEGVYLPMEGATRYRAEEGSTEPVAYMKFYSNPGESYYKFADSSWTEANTQGVNNAPIKAFTKSRGNLSIKTAEDLREFSESVGSGNSFQGNTIVLENDIDLSSTPFEPIGNLENQFLGSFKGNNHVIKGIQIDKTSKYAGLFGYLGSGSIISNLALENGNITGTEFVGSFAGYSNNAVFENCYSTLNVSGESRVGGIAGFADNTSFSSIHFSGKVEAENASGAFVGFNNNSIFSRCYYLDSAYSVASSNPVTGIKQATAIEMKEGSVSYELDGGSSPSTRTYKWKKGEMFPLFATNKTDAVFKIELFDTKTTDSDYVFVCANENLQVIASQKREGYLCNLYSDYSCTLVFDSTVASDLILFVIWENISFKEDSEIKFLDEKYVVCLNEYQNTVGEVRSQFKNHSIEFFDPWGNLLEDARFISTGTTVVLKDSAGNIVDKKIFILFGDTNEDSVIDVFDLTIMHSYISYEINDWEISEHQILSMDTSHDDIIDEMDMVHMNLATIFIKQIEQNPFK